MSRRLKFNENQLALPFGIATSMSFRARYFLVLAGLSLASLLCYMYAINITARNIALAQDLEAKIRETSANLNSLEFAYIELRNNVTLELAYQYGFQEVKNPLYVERTRPASLSFNTLTR